MTDETFQRAFPELAAALDLIQAGIPIAPGYPPCEIPGEGMIGCACNHGACPAPGRHLLAGLSTQDLTTDPDRARQWWGGGQPWSLLTVTGPPRGVDVIELSYQEPLDGVLGWLGRRGLADLAVITGDERVRFLTAADQEHANYAPLPGGWVRTPAHGELVLLPPSRLPGGRPLRWHRPLTTDAALVDCAALFAALEELPVPVELAAATHRLVQRRRTTGRPR
jgi:hypothetical protein